eukprot:gene2028-3944_t
MAKANLEPIPIERDLELQDIVMKSMGQSIKRVGKKLHNVELFMHYQPSDHVEYADVWRHRLENLLHDESVVEFPTIVDIRRKWKKAHPDPVILSTGEVLDKQKELAEEAARKAKILARSIQKKSLIRLAKSRNDSHSGKSSGLGRKPEGEVLRIIHNYSGVNSACENGIRVLTRKQGLHGSLELTSSLPTWIDPSHYHKDNESCLHERPDSSYKVAFVATGRSPLPNHPHVVDNPKDSTSPNITISKSSPRRRTKIIKSDIDEIPRYRRSLASSDAIPHEFNPHVSVWSTMSSTSTMDIPSITTGKQTPKNVYLGPLSYSEEILSSSSYKRGQSIISDENQDLFSIISQKSSISIDEYILNLKKQEDRKYHPKDYTKGGLTLQIPKKKEDEIIEDRPMVKALLGSFRVDPKDDEPTAVSIPAPIPATEITTSIVDRDEAKSRRHKLSLPKGPRVHTSSTNTMSKSVSVSEQSECKEENTRQLMGSNSFTSYSSLSPLKLHTQTRLTRTTTFRNSSFGSPIDVKNRYLSPVRNLSRRHSAKASRDGSLLLSDSPDINLKGLLLPGKGVIPDGTAAAACYDYSPRDVNERPSSSTTSIAVLSELVHLPVISLDDLNYESADDDYAESSIAKGTTLATSIKSFNIIPLVFKVDSDLYCCFLAWLDNSD